MKIAFISTFPPRKCGLATFCNNMINSIVPYLGKNDSIVIYSMVTSGTQELTPDTTTHIHYIREDKREDYRKAAKQINSECSVCIIQFEFSIFGGRDGVYLLNLMAFLTIPVITILHTILKNPSFHQFLVVKQVAHYSDKLVVMAQMAVKLLKSVYQIPDQLIKVIEHGLPDYKSLDKKATKADFGWEGKNILMTFGLISPGKGYEYALKALPNIISKNKETLFIVIGETHPAVLRNQGETYRNKLKALIIKLKLQKHVVFIDRHVTELELMNYLSVADIYICPYLNEEQITSGTLSYALGSGAAIISTPFWHSKEIFNKGLILNFHFKDIHSLQQQVNQLLDDKILLHRYQNQAIEYGYSLTWPKIGKRYFTFISSLIKSLPLHKNQKQHAVSSNNISYLEYLTDSFGLFQHASGSTIKYSEGYCTDDNARALLYLALYSQKKRELVHPRLINTYLTFLEVAQNNEGWFYNMAKYPTQTFEKGYSEDAFGRVIWALGVVLNSPLLIHWHNRARILFDSALSWITKLTSPRSVACCLLGTIYSNNTELSVKLVNQLLKWFGKTANATWNWFEKYMTYDNGLLPYSLLEASDNLNNQKARDVGLRSLDFLNSFLFRNNYLTVIGNENWFKIGGTPAEFSQQPIDVMGTILANSKAFQVTKSLPYKNNVKKAMNWYYGENCLYAPLYDPFLKTCHDGLDVNGVNENTGAESLIAYLISFLENDSIGV